MTVLLKIVTRIASLDSVSYARSSGCVDSGTVIAVGCPACLVTCDYEDTVEC